VTESNANADPATTDSPGVRKLVVVLDAISRGCASAPLRLGIFGMVALTLAWPALGTAGAMNFFRDAQVLMPYEDHAVDAVLHFGQLPLWDPYYCGGIFALGTPQSRFASPTFLLSLLFGTLRAESLTVFVMLWIGLEGAYRYARSRGASSFGSLLASPVFAASGNFATSFFHGWINFYGFELLPWALYGVRRSAAGSIWGIAITAGSLAWIIGFGGTYAAPMAAVLCALEVFEALLSRIRQPRALGRALSYVATAALFALGLGALRLLPVLETFSVSERLLADHPGLAWAPAYQALFGDLRFAGNNLRSLDGAFFVGMLAMPVAVIGALRLRSLPVLAVGAASFWAATGYVYGWSPFVGLRALPVFSALRYPERYLIVVALTLCVLAAWGITRLELATRKHAAWGLLLGAASLALVANLVPMARRHHQPVEHMDLVDPPAVLDRPFHQARGTRWALGYYGPMSRGCMSCWDAYPVPQSPLLRADLDDEEYLVDPSKGSARRSSWSPNRIDLEVDLREPTRLRVNQNWHPGWRSSVGTVVSDQGLLAVDLPSGRSDVTLRFVPRAVVAGLLASLTAAGALAWMLWTRRRKPPNRRRWWLHLLLSFAPFVVIAVVHLVVREAPMQPPSPLTPGGEMVVVDELPESVVPMDARFLPGVALVGARVTPPALSTGQDLTVELDWRVEDGVPRGAGVFVHVLSESGAFFSLDHTRMSGAFELASAPRNKVIRDIVVHKIPASMKKERWTVWVGVWNAFGDHARFPVQSEKSEEVKNTRVKVGSFVVR